MCSSLFICTRWRRWLLIHKWKLVFCCGVFWICELLLGLYCNFCVYTSPEFLIPPAGKCRVDLHQLGQVQLNTSLVPEFSTTVIANPQVMKGGVVKPSHCVASQKLAIIIPYKDREEQLKILLHRLHTMLNKQLLQYTIFVVEQVNNDTFNKGRLMNRGYTEALKISDFDCFIFHDVDMIPENDQNLYMCDNHARHLSPAVDEMGYSLAYYKLVGGVLAITSVNFSKINGYSNGYWGWGGEDDDLANRIISSGMLISRPPYSIGRYTMIKHIKSDKSPIASTLLRNWHENWNDGLNIVLSKTKVDTIIKHPLFTNITVDVGDAPEMPPSSSFWWPF